MCEPRGCGGGARVSPAPGGAPRGRRTGPGWGSERLCSVPPAGERLFVPAAEMGPRQSRAWPLQGGRRGGCPGAGRAEISGGSENYRVLRRLLLIAAARVEVGENRGRGGMTKPGAGEGKAVSEGKLQTGGRGPQPAARGLRSPVPRGRQRSLPCRQDVSPLAGSRDSELPIWRWFHKKKKPTQQQKT